MKFAAFVLGVLTGVVGAYLVLTRLWWPDVRIPGNRTFGADTTSTPLPQEVPPQAPIPAEVASPALPQALPSPGLIEPEQSPPMADPGPPTQTPPFALKLELPILTSDVDKLRGRGLRIPVAGIAQEALRDSFDENRGGRHHNAIDIMAPRGASVVAVEDARVEKLFTSKAGGLTLYLFDARGEYCYYYAHLDRYAPGLAQGVSVRKGDLIGYVGSTGNAVPDAPHLHFTIFRLGPEKRWWEGTSINAYLLWTAPAP